MCERSAIVAAFVLALAACTSGGDSGSAGATPSPGASTSPPPQTDAATQAVAPVSALFVLGDSLSDVGNAARRGRLRARENDRASDRRPLQSVRRTGAVARLRGRDLSQEPCQRRSRRGRVSGHGLGLPALGPSLHVVPSRPSAEGITPSRARRRVAEASRTSPRQVDVLLLDRAAVGRGRAVRRHHRRQRRDRGVASRERRRPDGRRIERGDRDGGGRRDRRRSRAAARLRRAPTRGRQRPGPSRAARRCGRQMARVESTPDAVLATATAVSDDFDRELAARLDVIEAERAWDSPQPP